MNLKKKYNKFFVTRLSQKIYYIFFSKPENTYKLYVQDDDETVSSRDEPVRKATKTRVPPHLMAGRQKFSNSGIKGPHIPVKLSKQPKMSEDDEHRLNLAIQYREWFFDNRVTHECNLFNTKYGKAIVPMMWPSDPEGCIAARSRSDSIQAKVDSSMTKLSQQRSDVVLLIWQEELESKDITIPHLPTDNISEAPVYMNAITGSHTKSSGQTQHLSDPTNPEFQNIMAEIVVCRRTTQNMWLAKMFGELDNTIKEISEGATAWDIIKDIHNTWVEIEAKRVSVKQKKHEFAEYMKGKRAANLKHAPNSFNNMRVLGTKTGRLWEVIYEIFNVVKQPKGRGKGGKTARKNTTPSVGHFYHMADIPDDHLTSWATRVKKGSMSSLEFQKECHKWKKTQRIARLIVTHVNAKEAKNYDSYDQLPRDYPFMSAPGWLETVVGWCSDKMKDELAVSVKQLIHSGIEQHKKNLQNQERGVTVHQV